LLGLLEPAPRHGYELKREFDESFAPSRPLDFGQVYATLSRLERSGKVRRVGEESGSGPARKYYAITPGGRSALEKWLFIPQPSHPFLQSELFVKVLVAVKSGRDAQHLLDAQRARHLEEMQSLTEAKEGAALGETVLLDYALFHLEADLRWIDHTSRRLERIGREVRP
jgi:DNA-binding PadR family transcriptional regulator